jgi:citrate lyase subunit beta / citryl-CoA lyase
MLDRPLRSLMFVPGHRRRMLERALGVAGFPTSGLDAAILDLEDGVPPSEKDLARREVGNATERTASAPGPARLVRIDRPGDREQAADIQAIAAMKIDGLVVPKVEASRELDDLARLGIPLIASIESAHGLLNAADIARHEGVVALLFGAEDYALDLGLPTKREGEARDLLYARSAVVVAAVAAGRRAIDGIWPDLDDAEGLRRDALHARRLGFSGKSLIHPGQIDVVNDVFGPSAVELEHARRVVSAYDEAVARGAGAVSLEGTLLDRPIVERARRTLKVHDAISRK